MFLKDTKYF